MCLALHNFDSKYINCLYFLQLINWLIWWSVRTIYLSKKLQEPKELKTDIISEVNSKRGGILCLAGVHFFFWVSGQFIEPPDPADGIHWVWGLIYRTHMSVEAVRHELKLSIGRDEGDGAVVLKARQTDTLVELHIFQLYGFTLSSSRKKQEVILK